MCKLFRKFFSNNIDELVPCEYLMSIWPVDHIEKKQTLYPRKDCIDELCKSLS